MFRKECEGVGTRLDDDDDVSHPLERHSGEAMSDGLVVTSLSDAP